MTTYSAGDILLIAFPFSDGGTKRRPALVLVDTDDADVILARVTSAQAQTSFDIVLHDWQAAGLLLPSVVRVDKIATIEKSLVERRLGHLTIADMAAVATICKNVFTDWLS